MTDREKLIDLLETHCAVIGEENCKAAKGEKCSTKDCANCLADHLISHGVTVREKQKSLTLEEAKERKAVWLDYDDELFPSLYVYRGYPHHSVYIAPQYEDDNLWLDNEEYGETWRCWAEKPTDEERKAAEWL